MGNVRSKEFRNYELKTFLEEAAKALPYLIREKFIFDGAYDEIMVYSILTIEKDAYGKMCYKVQINQQSSQGDIGKHVSRIRVLNPSQNVSRMVMRGYLKSLYGPYIFGCLRKVFKLKDNNYHGIGKDLFKTTYRAIMDNIVDYGMDLLRNRKTEELEKLLLFKKMKYADRFPIKTVQCYKKKNISNENGDIMA